MKAKNYNSVEDQDGNSSKPLLVAGQIVWLDYDLAKTRADEFAKNGDAKVGTMRSASQGTFDILPANGSAEDSIGGVYDKSTVKKIARVVVTIEYNTQP